MSILSCTYLGTPSRIGDATVAAGLEEPLSVTRDAEGLESAYQQRELNFTNPRAPGLHSLLSPIPGTRANELDAVERLAQRSPAAWLAFTGAVHSGIVGQLGKGTDEQRARSRSLSMRMFDDYVRTRYGEVGVTPENAVMWGRGGPNHIADSSDPASGTWSLAVQVTRDGYFDFAGGYSPPGLVATHEIRHLEEMRRGQVSVSPFVELIASVQSIVLADQIHKEVRGIALEDEVDYGARLRWQDRRIDVGRFANLVRDLETRYGGIGAALTSPEFVDLVEGRDRSLATAGTP